MKQLALVMIVRDEAARIGRCLESARALVDDIVVLDTGSSDATMDIARSHGARVFQEQWNDDFAAARNAALAHSSSDWNLVLDADEWLVGADRAALAEVLSGPPVIGLLPVSSQFELQGRVETSTSWIARLLPGDVRYAGSIHEQPVSSLPRKHVALAVQHDGYRAAGMTAKLARNASLLERAIAASPQDAYLLYQLGKNHEIGGEYTQAAPYYRQALELADADAPFRHDLVVRSMFTMKKAGLHEEAIHLADLEMGNWQDSPDYYFALGDLLLDWTVHNPAAADELLPMVEASFLRCLEIGDQPQRDGSVRGRGSHLAAHNLAVLYEGMGDMAKAQQYRAMAPG
jgi:glycosyltransferase involved in cell wall biosynthesis